MAVGGLFRSNTAERLVELALERTEDVDKRNELLLAYVREREETRRAEIARVTVPWVDALHKMGRQLYIGGVTAAVFALIALGHGEQLARYAEFIVGALSLGGLYVGLKGRGR